MAINDEEFLRVLKTGFESVHTELSKTTGAMEGRMSVLEREVNEMKIRINPVLRTFETDISPAAKMELLKLNVENATKDLDDRLNSLESHRWAVIGFSLSSLLIAVCTLVWYIITMSRDA